MFNTYVLFKIFIDNNYYQFDITNYIDILKFENKYKKRQKKS